MRSNPSHKRIVAAAVAQPSARKATIFVGDGGYGDILGSVGGATPNRHFEVYATAERPLDADDLNYLKAKGCFTLPEQSEELLEAYFKYAHPTFPIIDLLEFSQGYADYGLQGINLLLLWSMFSVSASYVQGTPRISNKKLFVSRAKLLFDISQEHDKMILVHSALLLSFWFADTEDVKQSWYWTSIAFGIAQSLGLHALEAGDDQNHSQQRIGRITWQCCLIRDVWLAFGMGRPLRVIAPDSSVSSKPLDLQLADVAFRGRRLYSVDEALELQHMWQSLVETSKLLRNIVIGNTVPAVTTTLLQSSPSTLQTSSSTLITHVSLHLELHRLTTANALARARNETSELESAVDGAIAIMESMVKDGTVNFASPVVVPLVTPAMTSCLDTARLKESDGTPENTRLVAAKLDAISKFLNALEGNYPAASILKQVLKTARIEISNS